jgi:hypothetical protein
MIYLWFYELSMLTPNRNFYTREFFYDLASIKDA